MSSKPKLLRLGSSSGSTLLASKPTKEVSPFRAPDKDELLMPPFLFTFDYNRDPNLIPYEAVGKAGVVNSFFNGKKFPVVGEGVENIIVNVLKICAGRSLPRIDRYAQVNFGWNPTELFHLAALMYGRPGLLSGVDGLFITGERSRWPHVASGGVNTAFAYERNEPRVWKEDEDSAVWETPLKVKHLDPTRWNEEVTFGPNHTNCGVVFLQRTAVLL